MVEEMRWIQRFNNFNKALGQLERFLSEEALNEMEEQGLIKAFEYTFELSWKTLQDLLKANGYSGIVGPRPVFEQSFHDGYISAGKNWMQMLKSRNLTSHTYNEDLVKEIVADIKNIYFSLFKDLQQKLEEEKTGPKSPF